MHSHAAIAEQRRELLVVLPKERWVQAALQRLADPTGHANQRIAADRTWFDVVAEPPALPPSFARVTTLQARVETPNLLTEGDL